MQGNDAYRLGYWSSLAVTAAVAAFGLVLIIGFWTPSLMYAFIPAILLAPSFVAMMTAIHGQAPAEKRIWTHLSVSFAVIYAVLILITYYTQLTVIRANHLGISAEVLKPFLFKPGTVLFALDMLGYGFMCLSTWVAAPAFTGGGLSLWIRRWLILHGLFFFSSVLTPLIGFPEAPVGGRDYGALALVGWCVIFLPISIMLAVYFNRKR